MSIDRYKVESVDPYDLEKDENGWLVLYEDVESLRQQLAEVNELFADAVKQLAEASRKRKESQARESVLRDALQDYARREEAEGFFSSLAHKTLAIPDRNVREHQIDSRALERAVIADRQRPCLYGGSRPVLSPKMSRGTLRNASL